MRLLHINVPEYFIMGERVADFLDNAKVERNFAEKIPPPSYE